MRVMNTAFDDDVDVDISTMMHCWLVARKLGALVLGPCGWSLLLVVNCAHVVKPSLQDSADAVLFWMLPAGHEKEMLFCRKACTLHVLLVAADPAEVD